MWNHIIHLCLLSLALGALLPSKDRNKRGNVVYLQRLRAATVVSYSIALLADLEIEEPQQIREYNKIELQKEISQCKERLAQYEASSCLTFRNSSDIHIIHVPDIEPFWVLCESDIENGGWIIIQRRLDGSVNFQRSWNNYRDGFGDMRGEFFIGLEKLHKLTKAQPQELYIYLEKSDYSTSFYWFKDFIIGSEEEGYMLKSVRDGDFVDWNHWTIGSKFTTIDRDNDKYWWGNCAKEFGGGWWFGSCEWDFRKDPFTHG